MAETFNFGYGGWDVHFDMPALTNTQLIRLISDSAFREADLEAVGRTGTVEIKRTSTTYKITVYDTNGDDIEVQEVTMPAGAAHVRITAHNNEISVEIGYRWVACFLLRYCHHEETPSLKLYANPNKVLTNIRRVELDDCRAEVRIDPDAGAANAISSVLSNKPVLVWSRYDGAICYAYTVPEQQVWLYHASVIERTQEIGRAASDMIVLGENAAVLLDAYVLEHFGLLSRMLRFPQEEAGALKAGRRALLQGRQSTRKLGVTIPIDPRLEMYDIVRLQAIAGSALVGIDEYFVVENLTHTLGGSIQTRIEGNHEADS